MTRSLVSTYPLPSIHRALHLVRHNILVYRHFWAQFVSAFFEPVFYLVAVGFGVGQFVDTISFGGRELSYAEFMAPGMLAVSVLYGGLFDGYFNPFFKLNWTSIYEGIVTTPLDISDVALGEIIWAVLRIVLYAIAFLIVAALLGLISSWWALLVLPAVVVAGSAFAAGFMCLTAITTQVSAFDKVMTLVVLPMFLFSGTFVPVTVYPEALQPVVMATPLFHVVSLLRGLMTGAVGLHLLWHVAYLVAMFVACGTFVVWKLRRRLIT